MPVPDIDFDVTEVAVPWHHLAERGFEVVFATESGTTTPVADPRLLDGVIFGRLGAADEPRAFYRRLLDEETYRHPVPWDAVDPSTFDGLLLPGGHAPGMRQYLGSSVLQQQVARFWELDRPVGAICHGVLVLARAVDDRTGRSVLAARRTTCLPKFMERSAYLATAWRLGSYYRTYPTYVEDEVVAALDDPSTFARGPRSLQRDGAVTDSRGFAVVDDNYVSARWPGDAYTFSRRFCELLG